MFGSMFGVPGSTFRVRRSGFGVGPPNTEPELSTGTRNMNIEPNMNTNREPRTWKREQEKASRCLPF
jgi:hypothetical protein